MESEPQEATPEEPVGGDAPPPFQPDPEIVTVLERGRNRGEETRMRDAVRRLGDRPA
jgi:hypothetical protein